MERGEHEFLLSVISSKVSKAKDMSEELYVVLGKGGRYSGKWGNTWPL